MMVSVIPGHDVLALLAARGGRCAVAELRDSALAAFGGDAVFGNCHGDRFDFDGLMAFLASRGKVVIDGRDAVLGPVAACAHG